MYLDATAVNNLNQVIVIASLEYMGCKFYGVIDGRLCYTKNLMYTGIILLEQQTILTQNL